MDLKIKGKNAFITGGTRGLGLASLKSLASEGVNIAFLVLVPYKFPPNGVLVDVVWL